jgi:aminoglycoside phosphotransferase (APT) family kinase protein
MEGVMVPMVWQHRDYGVWNLARSGNALAVLDWEGARLGPPLCDMLYLATTWDIAIRRPARLEEEIGNFGALFLAPPRSDVYRIAARDAIRRYLTKLDLDVGLVPLLLLHHRLELAVRRVDQLDDRGAAPSGRRRGDVWVAAVELLAEHADALFHTWR